MMEGLFGILVIAIIISLLIFSSWQKEQEKKRDRELLQTVTDLNSGTRSERYLVLALLKHGISPQAIWHDLYIQKANGEYTQIDVVVATKAGIIVFEDKCYGGWIFGNGKSDYWTKVMAFGDEKYKFYNPIKQNSWHINYLKKLLCEDIPFFSVIVFNGDCELRDISSIPNGTYVVYPKQVLQVVDAIINGKQVSYKNKQNVVAVLKKGVENGKNPSIREQHRIRMQNKFGKD